MNRIDIPEDLVRMSVDLFHPDDQINQMLEELGELIVAVNHYRRGRIGLEPLVEEMADVVLTISQSLATLSDITTGNTQNLDPMFQNMLLQKAKKLRSKIEKQTTNPTS